MGKENFIWDGEVFIKYEPDDNLEYKEYLRRQQGEFEQQVDEFTKLVKGVCPDAKVFSFSPEEELLEATPDLNYNGMDTAWIFKYYEGMYVFISTNKNEYGNRSTMAFIRLEDALKEFRPLRDIIAKEPIVGRKVKTDEFEDDLYSIYELPNVIITCSFDENREIKKVLTFPRVLPEPVPYDNNGPKLILKNPHKLVEVIYRDLDDEID